MPFLTAAADTMATWLLPAPPASHSTHCVTQSDLVSLGPDLGLYLPSFFTFRFLPFRSTCLVIGSVCSLAVRLCSALPALCRISAVQSSIEQRWWLTAAEAALKTWLHFSPPLPTPSETLFALPRDNEHVGHWREGEGESCCIPPTIAN